MTHLQMSLCVQGIGSIFDRGVSTSSGVSDTGVVTRRSRPPALDTPTGDVQSSRFVRFEPTRFAYGIGSSLACHSGDVDSASVAS